MAEKNAKQNRTIFFDQLRVLAALSVVMLHCAAQFWYEIPVTELNWKIANSYDACFRFGVPVFVMISGALFLEREKQTPWKRMFSHNILRLMVCYFLWNALYGLYDCYGFGYENLTIRQMLKEMLSGRYHLWFLPMLAGIYALCPILQEWVKSAKQSTLQYFLGLFFCLEIVRMTVLPFIHNNEILHILSLLEIPMVCGYVGYFVLGYYLMHYDVSDNIRRILYVGCLPALVYNVLASNIISEREGVPRGDIYDCFSLGTFWIVLAIFLFFKERTTAQEADKVKENPTHEADKVKENPAQKNTIGREGAGWKEKIWRELSDNTFGVYLMHVGFLEIAKQLGLHVMVLPIGIGIPMMVVVTFIVCNCLAALLRRIPVVGRFIC